VSEWGRKRREDLHSHALRGDGELLLEFDVVVGHVLLGSSGVRLVILSAGKVKFAVGFGATSDFRDGSASGRRDSASRSARLDEGAEWRDESGDVERGGWARRFSDEATEARDTLEKGLTSVFEVRLPMLVMI
jgi:hypothetical protein